MRNLRTEEIEILRHNNCYCEDWGGIIVSDSFEVESVRNVGFGGRVVIGERCRIMNVLRIENYEIGDDVRIEDCGEIVTEIGTSFGIGERISVLNEMGGMEVRLSEWLTSNLAYMVVFDGVNIDKMVEREIARIDKFGKIGNGSKIISCGRIKNVRIGECADIQIVTSLEDGTILSCKEQRTSVKNGVICEKFVIAEGAEILDNSIIKRCYVGNCVKIGGGYYAENCLVFGNSELYCGEGISVFAGPFTVSHHKSTLLIGEYMLFFNAGSGTNGSNHHYRLGPSHYSVLERGVKTGSGAYLLHPAKIGLFTMVVGSHKSHVDTRKFPFSLLVEKDGDSFLLPGQNLKTIANFRDEQKWMKRDRRVVRRDKITAEIFNEMIIERMMEAINEIDKISETEGEIVMYHGVRIKKMMLQRAKKQYGQTVEMIGMEIDGHYRDIGGAIVKVEDVEELEARIAMGEYETMKEAGEAFEGIFESKKEVRKSGKKELYEEYMKTILADGKKDYFDGEKYKYEYEENPDIIACKEYFNEIISKLDE